MMWAERTKVDRDLLNAVRGAVDAPPTDYVHQQGWVLKAFRERAKEANTWLDRHDAGRPGDFLCP